RLPLAIHYGDDGGRAPCVACTTCDGFACAIGAKNDIATAVLPPLLARGLVLETHTAAVRLIAEHGRITGVECVREPSGERVVHRARAVILAAGALASPHLVLASGLERLNPARDAVGRYLMRHCNAIVYGVFPRRPNPERVFHKQLGIHDYYFGHPSVAQPQGPLGAIQQLSTPPLALVRERAPAGLGKLIAPAVEHLTGLLVIAADQPRAENRVTIDPDDRDRIGPPRLVITHHYTERDLAARRALIRAARRILWRAGARWFYVHRIRTFSHAAGTLRIGVDAASSPLDEWGRFRGLENLYVADGSFMPTSGAVNPSLTIAARGLRGGERVPPALAEGSAHAPRPAPRPRGPRNPRSSPHRGTTDAMTTRPPLRLAFLGCGLAARMHARTLRRFKDEALCYFASRRPGVAWEHARRYGGAGAFESYDAALADPRIDAALVLTPPALHLEWTVRALEAGKHVVVEKPAFPRAADFDHASDAARRAGRRVLVAENYAYKPALAYLRE